MNQYKDDMLALQNSVRPLRSIADELRDALKGSKQFKIRYQPIIDGKTKRVALAEALLRWTSPVLGEVLPGRFIYIAEQNGLIRDVTRMVLGKVCEDICDQDDLLVSVNVSTLDITDPAFPAEVADITSKFGVLPRQIILECTDTLTPEEAQKASAIVKKLRSQGHSVAIHELESGFTSFGFLKMPGFTLLKIDRVLLDEARQNEISRQNLQDALDESRAKGIKTLAFGIESEDEARLVNEMGFDLKQGFLYSLSLSIEELVDFTERSLPKSA